MSNTKEEYYTPPEEKDSQFQPEQIPGLNIPRINAKTSLKNLPTGSANGAFAQIINIPTGLSSV